MRWRTLVFVTGCVLAALPPNVRAQQGVYRIGYLGNTSEPTLPGVLKQRLEELGWKEGRNVVFEFRFAEGQVDRLPALAAELVERKVDIIVATTTPPALAASQATKTIPIVGISFDNPVRQGLVASLARPGGNVTGASYGDGPEIFGKDLGLLLEVVPRIRRVGVLSNSRGPNHALMLESLEPAARALAIELVLYDVQSPADFEDAYQRMAGDAVDALFVYGDAMFTAHRERIANLARRHRLPTMYTNRPHVEAGGLMSYAPSFPEIWRRGANYVDRILRGAKPADLPVEQPTKFEFVINLTTAKALGLEIAPAILSRADEIID